MRRKIVSVIVLLAAQLLIVQDARAFPDRPVKLVVSSPAGGPPDIMARLLSDKIAAALCQPIVVENRPGGGGGTIAAKSVLAAEPDGYTLMLGSTSSVLIGPLIQKSAGYTADSFTPVANLAESAEVLAVHPSVAATSVAELVKLAKSQPGKLSYGSAGVGSLPHIEGELLKARAGIDMSHVPYRGGGPAVSDLLGGQIQVMFSALTQLLPNVREGRLRGLAVTSATRSKLAPDLPTMMESGFDQFVTASVSFIVAPPNTPIAIRQQLNDAVAKALASPEVEQAFAKIGAQARPSTPNELGVYMAEQQRRWLKIVETTRITVE
ncbi:Bug family tripartite tricarboxylate transporter substrate binding protein [Rhodoplanes sp. Z2-YC6860]|uniref:Bug family tripartite tricarboxylate transporter substrate binding protein n=1 Tax=Rhodoplanes sp. Z2-YC6860 TaxID=674703 RepID=UPI00078CAECE|nr:tripartite tricarboxylate transporter substrate binding protein [Rhodoplanes sp. Z2-YC6860]AMN44641.1 DHA2 family major facilitator superfamily protein [Rhodoplanes sp. Z2-YC6860]